MAAAGSAGTLVRPAAWSGGVMAAARGGGGAGRGGMGRARGGGAQCMSRQSLVAAAPGRAGLSTLRREQQQRSRPALAGWARPRRRARRRRTRSSCSLSRAAAPLHGRVTRCRYAPPCGLRASACRSPQPPPPHPHTRAARDLRLPPRGFAIAPARGPRSPAHARRARAGRPGAGASARAAVTRRAWLGFARRATSGLVF